MKAKTTIKDPKIIALISNSFDKDGSPIKKRMLARKKQALEILDGDISYYNEFVNGYDVHNCLLIIAYPDRDL